MSQNPNGFNPSELDPNGNDGLDSLPKKADGSFDLEAMTAEQQAQYWKHQHDQSTRGSHKLLAEKEKLEADLAEARKGGNKGGGSPNNPDDEFKGFGLNESATGVLKKTAEIAKNATLRELANSPIFQQSLASGNKLRLEDAFRTLSSEKGYEHINDYRQEIIDEHFADPLAYPEDLLKVLRVIAGNVLWEHRDEIAVKNKPRHDRVDMLGGQGGNKGGGSAPIRTMEYWERLAKEDPQKFASPEMQKLFNEDMAKGID